MNDPKRRFFSGDSLQQALVQAANHFHLQPEEIAYHTIEKRHGFVKVRRKVVIEVDPDAPRKEPGATSAELPAVAAAQAPRPPAAEGPAAESDRRAAAGGAAPFREGGRARGSGRGRGRGAGRGSGRGEGRGEGRGVAPSHGASAGREAGPGAIQDRGAGAVPGYEARLLRQAEPALGSPVHASPHRAAELARDRGTPAGGGPGDEAWEDEVDPWNRAVPMPETSGPQAGHRPGRPASSPGMPDVGEDEDDDLQPPGLGQGLVSLPERPRNISERYSVAVGPQAEAAARGIELLLRIAGLSLQAKIYQGEERLEVDLSGPDTDWCFADDGEMLMSVEHLLPRVIRSLAGEAVLCRVDCDNFHEIREERLRSLAQRVADEVRQRGRARTLVPMNPADRRIIHVTLADNPAVVTESEGEGYFKRITVRPV